MAIHLDKATIARLVEARIETANDATGPATLRVIHTGEADPDPSEGAVWARVVSMKIARNPRRSTDEEPWGTIELMIGVSCSEAENQESAFAINSAVEAVSRVLECATLDDSGTSGHVIDLHQTEDQDERGGAFNQIVASEVTVFGQVRRVSGTSQETYH